MPLTFSTSSHNNASVNIRDKGTKPLMRLSHGEICRRMPWGGEWNTLKIGVMFAYPRINNRTTSIIYNGWMSLGVGSYGRTMCAPTWTSMNAIYWIPHGRSTSLGLSTGTWMDSQYNANGGNDWFQWSSNRGCPVAVMNGTRTAGSASSNGYSGIPINTIGGTASRRCFLIFLLVRTATGFNTYHMNSLEGNSGANYDRPYWDFMAEMGNYTLTTGFQTIRGTAADGMYDTAMSLAVTDQYGPLDTAFVYTPKLLRPIDIYAFGATRLQ